MDVVGWNGEAAKTKMTGDNCHLASPFASPRLPLRHIRAYFCTTAAISGLTHHTEHLRK